MTAVQHDYWEPEGFPAGCQQGTQSKSRGSFIVSCLVLEAFFQKAFQTQPADLFDITPNMLLLSLALTMSALHPLPVHPTGIKIRGYLWQAPHSNPSFMPENIRRSCSWLIEYSTIIPSRSAALSLPCVCVGLWYGTQGRDEAAVCWRGQWCWLTPLKTILKGFWWHIAVGPTAAYHMYFTRNDRTFNSFFLWTMWRGHGSCVPADTRPLTGSYSLSYREEQSLPFWFGFSFVWTCSLNYKHGCHMAMRKESSSVVCMRPSLQGSVECWRRCLQCRVGCVVF